MRKIRLEKVTGVVALTYLVLIPAGAFYAWQKIRAIDNDMNLVWEKMGLPPTEHQPSGFGRFFKNLV